MIVNVTRYTSPIAPSTVNSRLDSPRLARRSRNGTSTRNSAAIPNATTPSRSPSRPSTWLGTSFNVWKIARKYHSGRIPGGTTANGSAFTPVPRKERRERREDRDHHVPREHVPQDVVRKEPHLRQLLARAQLLLD